jgi:hypothetical protein
MFNFALTPSFELVIYRVILKNERNICITEHCFDHVHNLILAHLIQRLP